MRLIKCEKIGDAYIATEAFVYYSPRYDKTLTVEQGYPSNGANAVKDKCPTAFFAHDRGCERGKWDDGTPMCNRELSTMYADILWLNGFWIRAQIRWIGTFLFGGGQAKKNGLWKVK
jgi:hypothetical protein